jgi:hypothetical protein
MIRITVSTRKTEHQRGVVGIAASYSGDPRFKAYPGDRRFFVVVRILSRKMAGLYLELGHDT